MPTLVDVALAADRGDIYRVLLQTLEFTPMLKDIVRTATTPPKLALVKRCDEEITTVAQKGACVQGGDCLDCCEITEMTNDPWIAIAAGHRHCTADHGAESGAHGAGQRH